MATEELFGKYQITRSEVDRIIDANSVSEFYKLTGVPGYSASQPMTWDIASGLVKEHTFESLGQLGRDPADLVVYRRFKAQTLEEWSSMADYVQAHILGYETQTSAEDGKKSAVRPSSTPEQPPIIWRPNDFPYNLEEGVEHHNIWCSKPLTTDQIEQTARQHRQGWEFVYFINPEGLASIPAVWHAHVLSRRQSDALRTRHA
ncbi:hypothetical protein WJX73_008400 [Symbiochloris irregularis]|uniref:Uncharacterized protein n=1 Tax=Symbiochloris irregularis TaxID=706552 RepID=A0AAW1NXE1_9CHLO